jgi:HK97 family phage portal protein
MNIFKKLFQRRSTTSDPVEIGYGYNGQFNLSASEVSNPSQALKIAAVYRCTSILSGSIASLPLEVQRRKNGYYQVDPDSELSYLLGISPNARMTPYDFIRNLIIQVLNAGNAYVYYQLSDGHYVNLQLVSPNCCAYQEYQDTYVINDMYNHLYGTFDSDEIIHIRGMSRDGGYTGESVLHYAARTLGLATREAEQSNEIMQKGSTYKGFVSGDDDGARGFGPVQDSQLSTVSARIEDELRSGKNIMSLPGAMKFNQLSMSPADLQLLESKKFSVLDICRFYGVHPDKVFQNQSSNYKASDMAQVQYMIDTMQPYIRQIEQEFSRKLIPASMSKKMRIRFDLEEYYQLDFTTKAAYMKSTIESGTRTPNEWRAKDGRAPLDGGDQAFISCNVAPINSDKIKGTSAPQQGPENENNLKKSGKSAENEKNDAKSEENGENEE